MRQEAPEAYRELFIECIDHPRCSLSSQFKKRIVAVLLSNFEHLGEFFDQMISKNDGPLARLDGILSIDEEAPHPAVFRVQFDIRRMPRHIGFLHSLPGKLCAFPLDVNLRQERILIFFAAALVRLLLGGGRHL